MTKTHHQVRTHGLSLTDPETFWLRQAAQLHWSKAPSKATTISSKSLENGSSHPIWSWFPDGEISTSFNCIDRHVRAGNGDHTAIIWDSPVTNSKENISYQQLLLEVETLAAVLREQGVKKGEVVLIYMPMIPAAIYAVLATARLGAVHTVVFGGFSGPALAQRIDDARPRVIMTASCSIEGRKGNLPYQPLIQKARQLSNCFPSKTIIWQRSQLSWGPLDSSQGELDWLALVSNAKQRGLKADTVAIQSTDPLYILYTSGTTGAPKGVVRDAGGHAVGMNFCMRYVLGIQGSGDVVLAASDIGWVFGHSFIIYGPLLAGSTTVVYEGKPIGTPDANAFWRLISEHRVTILATAPSALRAIRSEDPEDELISEAGAQGRLSSLRAILLAGERSEPSIVRHFEDVISRYCPGPTRVVDNWWSTETGSPLTGLALGATDGLNTHLFGRPEPLESRPGSAGKPMPGYKVRVVDDTGTELAPEEPGNVVLDLPLGPTAFTSLWNDEARFYDSYLERFSGKYFDTGDRGLIDKDGYVHILSRSDDVINVAAHRLSLAAIEDVIMSNPSVADCCVVGMPDAQKGHAPCAFVTLVGHSSSRDPKVDQDIQKAVREHISPIARLGAIIQGHDIIPRTRSGKVLRRVLRDVVENTMEGGISEKIDVPVTVEDPAVIDRARVQFQRYLDSRAERGHMTRARAKL